jgi:hypothetical protein
MSCSMTNMLTSQTIIISLAVLSASVSSTDASHSLRGASTIYIDGDVTLMHLIGKVNNTELRRLNELVPTSKAIRVPCHNETSDCGIHGQCRISGNNRFCHCDGRYVSLEIDKPCDAKGANQMVLLIMWIMFGWTGGSMFGLGLSLFGTLVLLMCCCGVCFRGMGDATDVAYAKKKVGYSVLGVLMCLACVVLWLYGLIIISTDRCVDSRGVPCAW